MSVTWTEGLLILGILILCVWAAVWAYEDYRNDRKD